jgi:NADH-quinone oxidoreductase subunit D
VRRLERTPGADPAGTAAAGQPTGEPTDGGGPSTTVLNMGPQHPATHGVLRLVLELDGETVVRCVPEIGYLHTGIEKNIEHHTWTQAITDTDRMDYLSPLMNNLCYCLAVERLLGIEVPERCKFIRVLMAELSRIASHLVFLATYALDLGAISVFFYAFQAREAILDMYEAVSGVRMNLSYIRIGGLQYDIPPQLPGMVRRFLDEFPRWMHDFRALLDDNPIFLERTRGVGVLTAEQCRRWGVTGPSLRAAGVAYDVRKAAPYSGYERFEFAVPTRTEGDAYARYQVRMAEMEESAKIVRQALEGMPSGPWRCEDRKITLPPREELQTSMESLIHHFKLVSQGIRVPAGAVYQAVESPRGELGMYVVSDGGNRPYRVHVRAPSFYNTQALKEMLQGALVADAVAAVGSLDMIMGEVDR